MYTFTRFRSRKHLNQFHNRKWIETHTHIHKEIERECEKRRNKEKKHDVFTGCTFLITVRGIYFEHFNQYIYYNIERGVTEKKTKKKINIVPVINCIFLSNSCC